MIRRSLKSTLFPYTTLFRSVSLTQRTQRLGLLELIATGNKREADLLRDIREQARRQLETRGEEASELLGVNSQRSEEHTSELQSHSDLVCRLLLEKKKKNKN